MKKSKAFLSFLLVFSLLVLSSCMSYTSFEELANGKKNDTTTYEYQTSPEKENTTGIVEENTTAATVTLPEEVTTLQNVPETEIRQETLPSETRPQEITTAPPVQENTTAPAIQETTTDSQTEPSPDYSSFSKSQIIDTYAEALNKTRAFTGVLTVGHTESFNADIKDAHPGGALTELLASNIVKLVGSEGSQTLNFSGGKATNKDGESVPILLPQRTDFSLPPEGVASAAIEETGGKLHIRIVLVPETVSMGQIPKYNASAVGYLDTSNMDFKIITISRVDISYTGSVIDAVIRSDGYIESVTYTINMSTYAELSGMGITGYGTLEGAQTEKWQLNW